jgi:rhodanese-related sulfurtransferase
LAEVPRNGTVYVICARGSRSAKAAQHYRSQGIDAVNVAGGMLAWIDAGLPTDGAGSGAGGA